jgi:hypothetical protein
MLSEKLKKEDQPLLLTKIGLNAGLVIFWLVLGILNFSLNADLSRDLGQISEVIIGKLVWLGPQLRIGFPISPLYFYLFVPGVLFSGGSAYSLVATQVCIAGACFSLLLFTEKQKTILENYVFSLFLGLSSWWVVATIKPWNGNQYVLWLLFALVSLWTKKRLWLSLLLFGIAVAIHPAALVLTPIFLFETYRFKPLVIWKKIVLFAGGLIGPWAPILAFEYITKGFLIRQWLEHKDAGMSFAPGFHNLVSLIQQFQLPILVTITLLAASIYMSKGRTRTWYLLLIPALLFLAIVSNLHAYYLLGVLAALFFLIAQTLYSSRIGKLLLGIGIAFFIFNIPQTYSFDINNLQTNRYQKIVSLVEKLKEEQVVTEQQTYALISVIDDQNSTPQADDYRFVFRTNELQASNIDQYPQADTLIIFFENDQQNPEQWRDWHSDHFGEKKLVSSKRYGNFQVVVYTR